MEKANDFVTMFHPFKRLVNGDTRLICVGENVLAVKHIHHLDKQPIVDPRGWKPPASDPWNVQVLELEQLTHNTLPVGYCDRCNILYVAKEPNDEQAGRAQGPAGGVGSIAANSAADHTCEG